MIPKRLIFLSNRHLRDYWAEYCKARWKPDIRTEDEYHTWIRNNIDNLNSNSYRIYHGSSTIDTCSICRAQPFYGMSIYILYNGRSAKPVQSICTLFGEYIYPKTECRIQRKCKAF